MAFFSVEVSVFAVEGPHALRYLNARLSNDIRPLSLERCCLAAALNAQGKAAGVFVVLRTSEEGFLLISEGGNPEEQEAAIKQFIVADRVTVTNQSDQFRLVHLTEGSSAATIIPESFPGFDEEFQAAEIDGMRAYSMHRTPQLGIDVLLPAERAPEVEAALLAKNERRLSEAEQSLLRILGGRAAYGKEITGDRAFSEFGLEEAISSTKGCYVGQEVVERIASRGKAPRRLVRLRTEGSVPLAADQSVSSANGSEEVGRILTSAGAADGSETVCFALVKNAPEPPDEYQVAGRIFRVFQALREPLSAAERS